VLVEYTGQNKKTISRNVSAISAVLLKLEMNKYI